MPSHLPQPINDRILKKVPPERIHKRVWYLEELFRKMKAKEPDSATLGISKAKLLVLVKSYFYDIERLKDFHNIDLAEKCKIGAYTAKWLLKHRPVYFVEDVPEESVLVIFNERFALRAALTMAEIPPEAITSKLYREITYTFHYRTVSEDMLVLLLKALGGSEATTTG